MGQPSERVKIWNAFFKLAWSESRAIFECVHKCKSRDQFHPGETPVLPDNEFHILGAVVLCNLAIEARANHLIEELIEEGMISKDVGQSARRLPTKAKWFLLPTLAGKNNKLDGSSGPHQAVAQLCDLRNDFLHVNYAQLKNKMPDEKTVLSYFRRFVEAMEDMNVVLGRHSSPDKNIIGMGEFHCEDGQSKGEPAI